MIRRPPRSTQSRSSAASDVYKRQHTDVGIPLVIGGCEVRADRRRDGLWIVVVCSRSISLAGHDVVVLLGSRISREGNAMSDAVDAVSYTHLRAHETVLDLVCRLLLEKKKTNNTT
eukprot:TRINITY_DN30520_c0_g1_i1.p1 TRINITY_DN30520_c0_g1~~TRINITY_DN30520_c0_g1_i1.p1  ORF type:complete len:116 (-),score=53.78 TRINITY_DN30520_c0_g1_i1:13-360(-)